MKYILIICLFLTGCGGYVNDAEWAKCENKCKTNNGIDYYSASAAFVETCHCNNGAVFTISSDPIN